MVKTATITSFFFQKWLNEKIVSCSYFDAYSGARLAAKTREDEEKKIVL